MKGLLLRAGRVRSGLVWIGFDHVRSRSGPCCAALCCGVLGHVVSGREKRLESCTASDRSAELSGIGKTKGKGKIVRVVKKAGGEVRSREPSTMGCRGSA